MIKVYSALNPTDAHLVKGVLESHGFECEVTGENLFNLRGEIPLTPETAPSVWILDESRFDEARDIVLACQKENEASPRDYDIWICQVCGEDSEGQFAKCWNCGSLRDEKTKEPVPREKEQGV